MKKLFYSICTVAALLASGCSDSEDTYTPDLTFRTTGDITMIASIENCGTRASLVGTGETRWLKEDAITVVCTDDTPVTLALDGTGETRRAFFSGSIPEGKQLGGWAFHPAGITFANDNLGFSLPSQITPGSSGSCSLMAAQIDNSCEIAFKHMLSYVTVQLSEVSSYATRIELVADKNLSGDFTATMPDAFETGVRAVEGNNKLTIVLPEKVDPDLSATFAIPVGEYTSIVATQFDSKDKNIGQVELLTAPLSAGRADMRTLTAALPKYAPKVPIEGTALVAGIYWALGNLQHVVGSTDEGFQTDWRIAPEQWQYVNSENAGALGKKVTFEPSTYDECDHFNWGGIASPFDNETTSMAIPTVGTDISGKMYTSQNCTTETTDFTAAKFGDLAFWASNGKFRMPTNDEIQKLLDEAFYQYGYYTIAPGKVVSGFLFTDPEEGQEPGPNDAEVEFTAEDIARGLFLPKAGRRYNAQAFRVDVQGTQGTYWSSVATTGTDATEPSYGTVMHINSAKITYPYWNKAFDAKAGFLIRPVYIVK